MPLDKSINIIVMLDYVNVVRKNCTYQICLHNATMMVAKVRNVMRHKMKLHFVNIYA